MLKRTQLIVTRFSIKFLLALILLLSLSSSVSSSSRTRSILQYDTLVIQIWPIVEDLEIKYNSPSSRSASVQFSVNRSDCTYIWISPESKGSLNVTILFTANSPWDETIGIITDKPDFYPNLSSQSYYGVYSLVTLEADSMNSPGNITLNFILQVYERSPSIFSFEFPTSMNAVFFTVVAALLVYVNAFLLLDLHFKSKMEGVSRKRWLLVTILVVVSLYIVYQLYIFTTFTRIWGV